MIIIRINNENQADDTLAIVAIYCSLNIIGTDLAGLARTSVEYIIELLLSARCSFEIYCNNFIKR